MKNIRKQSMRFMLTLSMLLATMVAFEQITVNGTVVDALSQPASYKAGFFVNNDVLLTVFIIIGVYIEVFFFVYPFKQVFISGKKSSVAANDNGVVARLRKKFLV